MLSLILQNNRRYCVFFEGAAIIVLTKNEKAWTRGLGGEIHWMEGLEGWMGGKALALEALGLAFDLP